VLTPDFIAAIVIENERRTLAGRGLSLKLDTDALIIAVQALLRLCGPVKGRRGDQKSRDQQSWVLSSESHSAFH
jgi:hypothetical protein